MLDSQGNLYGTTLEGGLFEGGTGFGTVFKIDPAGNETVLVSFGDDFNSAVWAGEFPNGDLVIDRNGNLFGTCQGYWDYDVAEDHGTVWELVL